MIKLAMIYMASGFGRRFGQNKLLVELSGKPLYQHGLEHLMEAGKMLRESKKLREAKPVREEPDISVEILVVSQYEEILEHARRLGITAIYNPNASEGIAASVRLGTLAAGEQTDYYGYFVADQPYMEAETLSEFVMEFLETGRGIGCVVSEGKPGSPNIFHRKYQEELLSLDGDRGGRQIIRKHPGDIWEKPVKKYEIKDIDYPENML